MIKVYEGYLHHEIGRWCHVVLHPPDIECPVCFKPFNECRKWGIPKMAEAKLKEDGSPTRAETILEKAERIVMGDREEMYGHPKDNHQCTAELWNAYLKRRKQTMPYADALISDELVPTDICFLNILQKVSRCANKISKDSLADIAGWARCVERIIDASIESNGGSA